MTVSKQETIVFNAALAALGEVENQLQAHERVGGYIGITEKDLCYLESLIRWFVDVKAGS